MNVYGIEKQIEYGCVVKPGGKVSDIGFEYKDVEKTREDDESNLIRISIPEISETSLGLSLSNPVAEGVSRAQKSVL